MPYIEDKQIRNALIHGELTPITVGELNFLITHLCHNYVLNHGLCYDTLNAVDGVLDCARIEFQRVVIAKYEDKKRLANGSISEFDAVQLGDIR